MFAVIALSEMFWTAAVEELQRGYVWDEASHSWLCLVCGQVFQQGRIYQDDSGLWEAEAAVVRHIKAEHGSTFQYLLGLNKKHTGLTEVQRDLLQCFYQGLDDREIARRQGSSASTVRNHRFKLREREKQARVFLALMGLLGQQGDFVTIHKGATVVDERFNITEAEMEKVLRNYFKDGRLTAFPAREKRKVMVLLHIARRFEPGKLYSEQEVNEIIKRVYDDYVTIRRYLIEYGYLERKADGSQYWVKN